MKKIILTAIIAILIASMFIISVSAAGATATTSSKSCEQGGTVTLTVSLSGASDILSGAVSVSYDDSVLELVSAKWSVSGALLASFDKSTEKGAFAFDEGKNLSGTVFSVTFKVRSDAPLGKSTVSCNIQLKTASGSVSVSNKSGSVDVTCNHDFTEKTDQYLASEANCTTPKKYYYTCSICHEKGSTTYPVGSSTGHNYNKKVATEDYLVTSVKCANEAEYYLSCSCGAKGTSKFTADASWSHNFSDYLYISESEHWYQCADCGAKKDQAGHKANSNNVCADCNFVVSGGAHYHSFDNAWKNDSDAHWHECSCGLKNDLELHKWSDKKDSTCLTCGIAKPVDDTGDAPSTDGMNPILAGGIGMVILFAVEAIGFVIFKAVAKKKK